VTQGFTPGNYTRLNRPATARAQRTAMAEHRRKQNWPNIGRNKGNWARGWVSHLGAELGEAWSGLRRAGWPETRARFSSGGWRRGQSTREGEAVQNEVRGVRGALVGLYRGSWARGRVSWLRNPATCECACAGPRRCAERAKLTGLAHGAEREKRDARGNGSTTGDLGP
jgi:hypothetical protein